MERLGFVFPPFHFTVQIANPGKGKEHRNRPVTYSIFKTSSILTSIEILSVTKDDLSFSPFFWVVLILCRLSDSQAFLSVSVFLQVILLFIFFPCFSFLLCDGFPNLLFVSWYHSPSWLFSVYFHIQNLLWDFLYIFKACRWLCFSFCFFLWRYSIANKIWCQYSVLKI